MKDYACWTQISIAICVHEHAAKRDANVRFTVEEFFWEVMGDLVF